jgi:preprotein translocase SecE subunit
VAKTEPEKTTKRRFKAPSPTVRQQAEKAQAAADNKPERNRRLKAAAASGRKPFAKVGKAFDRQPFRAIGKVFKFIGRILVPKFVRNAFGELRLVTWPGRKETRQLTFAVLIFATVFGAIITVVDYGLDKVFKALILNN